MLAVVLSGATLDTGLGAVLVGSVPKDVIWWLIPKEQCMSPRHFVSLVFLVLSCIFCPAMVGAQTNTVTLAGVATDEPAACCRARR